MKKQLLPLTLIALLATSALATDSSSEKDKSDDQGKASQTEAKATEEPAQAIPDETLTGCLELVPHKTSWVEIIRKTKNNVTDGANFWVEALEDGAKKEIEKLGAEATEEQKSNAIKKYKDDNGDSYYDCIGYTYIMVPREDGFASGRVKKSADGRVKCYNYGLHTMDYEACSKMIDAYDMASVAQVGLQAFQTIDYQATTSEATKDYLQDSSDPTSGLEAQKKSIKKQAEIANTQAAFHAAKVAALWAMYDKMPDEEALATNCNTFLSTEVQSIIANAKIASSKKGGVEQLCANSAQSSVSFLPNAGAKDDVKRIMAEEVMNAAAKTAQGALLNKQARKIKDAISEVNAFDPSSVVTVPETPDLCLANPNDESCTLADTRSDVDLLNNGFTVSGDWGGTNASSRADEDADGSSGTSTADTTSIAPSSIGTPLEDNSTAGGFASAPPAAGTVESGGSTTGGGGGGGSAGAVGLPGGGGGSGGSGAAGSSEELSKAKLAYSGGAGGARYAGNTSKKSSSGKDASKNPFDALFGKKTASKDNVLNFRDPASKEIGDKDGRSLFEMISNRYRVSQEKKRLIEYEIVEK